MPSLQSKLFRSTALFALACVTFSPFTAHAAQIQDKSAAIPSMALLTSQYRTLFAEKSSTAVKDANAIKLLFNKYPTLGTKYPTLATTLAQLAITDTKIPAKKTKVHGKVVITPAYFSTANVSLIAKAAINGFYKTNQSGAQGSSTTVANIVSGALGRSGISQANLLSAIVTGQTDPLLTGQVAKAAVSVTGNAALISTILNSTSIADASKPAFTQAAIGSVTGNPSLVGQIVGNVAATITNDPAFTIKLNLATNVLNSAASAASNVSAALVPYLAGSSALVSATNEANFGQQLSQQFPSSAGDIATGLVSGDATHAGLITASVITSNTATLNSASSIAAKVTSSIAATNADNVAAYIAFNYNNFPSLVTSATSIATSIASSILGLPSSTTPAAKAQAIADVTATLLGFPPITTGSGVDSAKATAILKAVANVSSDPTIVSTVAATLYNGFKNYFPNTTFANLIQSSFATNTATGVQAAITASINSVNQSASVDVPGSVTNSESSGF